MKPQVENFLKSKKEEIANSEKEKREEHLISLGLIDEGKTVRIYGPEGSNYDKEKKEYYYTRKAALDVTDEEYDEICKYCPPSKNNYRAETTLNVIADIVLVCGIIATLICAFTMTTDRHGDFVPVGFAITIGILLTSLVSWALLTTVRNISLNVKEINEKQNKK